MNQSIVIGRLVRDVELKFTPGQGKAIATGTVAVNRRIPKDKTDFINVQQWGAPAEKYFAQYGHKGRLVAVRGELNIDKWKDRDGNWKERSYIVASEINFLDKSSEYSDADTEGFTNMDLDDPDIPFQKGEYNLYKNKKRDLEFQMTEFVKCVLRHAEKAGQLNNIAIAISTDDGGLKMDYALSTVRKDYVLSKVT